MKLIGRSLSRQTVLINLLHPIEERLYVEVEQVYTAKGNTILVNNNEQSLYVKDKKRDQCHLTYLNTDCCH
jgi:hypothetical protein